MIRTQSQNGFSLVEALITIGIAVTIFTALFSATQYSAQLMANSSARLAAIALVTERMEYFRSLSYTDVGTVAGFPAGVIPQNRTVTLNGVTFNERVLVDYVNDPADDVAGVDDVITDYKKLKIEISWDAYGETELVSAVSNIVPVSIETNEGGGIINIEVNDADGSPLPGASVRVVNSTLSPAVDITRITGPTGIASIIVPAGSGYHASTTMVGYSVDKTYEVTGANPNPSPGSFTVVESLITDQGFKIGALSDIEIATFSSVIDASSTAMFTNWAGVVASSSVALSSGKLELEENLGIYEPNGTVLLQQIAPAAIVRWESVVLVGNAPAGTDYRVRLYTGTTTSYALVAEEDLPGNAAGLQERIINLSGLDVATYPDLTVELILTGDTSNTAWVDDVAVYYRASEMNRTGVDLTIRGKKTIGSPSVYKNQFAVTSDMNGQIGLTAVEFDEEYTITNTDGLRLTRVCSSADLDFQQMDVLFSHQAGITSVLELVFESTPADTLLVAVASDSGEPLPGATVILSRTGFSTTAVTNACGQAFIANTDGAQADYDITVSRVGYDDYSNNSYEISGDTRLEVALIET